MMSTPGIFVFITSIFKYYYFTSTRLACILVMRVESDSFWYTVKMDYFFYKDLHAWKVARNYARPEN